MRNFYKLFILASAISGFCLSSCNKPEYPEDPEVRFSVDAPTIAHRGYHVTAIENTEEAFIEAGKRNFIGIETDIYWTKDGYIICNHNNNIKGMTESIDKYTYEEIMQVNLSDDPDNPVRVTTFQRYLEICKEYNKIPVIEFKTTPSVYNCEFAIRMIQTVYDDELAPNNVLFISFGKQLCERMKKIATENNFTYSIYLLGSNERTVDEAIESGINVSLVHDIIDEDIGKKCKDAGIKLAAWTVNEEKYVERLMKCGVVTITSDVLECNPKYLQQDLDI